MKITDFFSYEELLDIVTMEDFRKLSSDYSDFFDVFKPESDMTQEEQVKGIRLVVMMLSSIFGFPIVIACDCYVKMLDTYDYFEDDKVAIMKDLAASLAEHSDDSIDMSPEAEMNMQPIDPSKPLDKLKDDMTKIVDAGIEAFKKSLEENWKKDQI